MNNLIIYGGSFDPLHNGHLNTALNVQNAFHFDQFIFLPCKTPVLKNANMASSEQRVLMLELAIAPYPDFEISLEEVMRPTPSFMVDTLEFFRKQLPDCAITLLIGMDSFLQLPQWHSWQKILTLSNLLVMTRPQVDEQRAGELIKNLLLTHEVTDKRALLTNRFGKIYRYNAGEYDVSSTWLREQIRSGVDIEPYLPASVYQYIKKQGLYQ